MLKFKMKYPIIYNLLKSVHISIQD